MKALSIRQPWADLIVDGKKSIETRKWNTHYRGWFYIHAPQKVEKSICEEYGVKPSATGAVIGKAFLYNVKKYTSKKEWDADLPAHYAKTMTKPTMYGFLLKDPQRVKPLPCRGQLSWGEFQR